MASISTDLDAVFFLLNNHTHKTTQKKMYLIFDTETTGFAKNGIQPNVIQLAFIQLNEKFEIIQTFSELIKPDNWTVPNEKFWIDNGYSTEGNEKNGIPMEQALKQFCDAVDNSTTLIAHNLKFDHPVMSAEMIKYKIMPTIKPMHKICTMESTVRFCNLKRKNSKVALKFPKLSELHIKLFGVDFENAHDALADVHATIRCFVELKKLKIL